MKLRPEFKFLLYVADDTPNSAVALVNLKTICEMHLRSSYEIEVIDVFKEPARALADRILMTPILIRVMPGPEKRIVGTLSQPDKVLNALGLQPDVA